jgi:hypothetical protein
MGNWWEDLSTQTRTVYSQWGEDGILARIFEGIGTTNKYLVDIGAGDGHNYSNTRLLLNNGWHGSLFDAAYAGDVHQERITAENVCDVLAKYNVPGEFDLLSLDIDGVDWWVLRALLKNYHPRAFVCEVNPNLPIDPPVTVYYDPEFRFENCNYFGASVGAFRRLGDLHGYRIVYVHESTNAFFVQREYIPEQAKFEVYFAPRYSWPPDPRQRPWHPLTEAEIIG